MFENVPVFGIVITALKFRRKVKRVFSIDNHIVERQLIRIKRQPMPYKNTTTAS